MFEISAELRRKRSGRSDLSGLRLRWLAFKADLAAKADPGRTEELILLGTKENG